MLQSLSTWVRRRPGFLVLIGIIVIICIRTLKPSLYMMGWDNYSSFFNIPTNVFRTLFSTWREYRGLGVPSDSEIVDIFRQLFFLILSPFTKRELLDQVYYVSCFTVGSIAMYAVVATCIRLIHETVSPKIRDWTSFVGAFFYIFNLSTTAIFYFPIVTYITRFAAIPLIALVFLYGIYGKHITRNVVIIGIGILFATSGSYITATVFVTMILFFFLFSLFQTNFRRILWTWGLFLMINAFWLLPFFNYSLQKVSIIRLAPTFIDANETQLNKSPSFYGFFKQSILYSNFFDSVYTDTITKHQVPFYPFLDLEKGSFLRYAWYVFPFFFIVGSLEMLLGPKKYRRLYFVPITILFFLFLSMKEYSVFGSVYRFFDHYIPYFGVLFRFGDTKFHPYIAFSGSIAAAIAVLKLSTIWQGRLQHRVSIWLGCVIFGLVIFAYRSYVVDGLVGKFMYVTLPLEYTQIADILNKESHDGRVLYLPFDRNAYWRSYQWGYLGSSFFHSMIDAPLIDKTFEPGSMENAYLHMQITRMMDNVQSLETIEDQKKRAEEAAVLFQNIGITHIVLDSTVSAEAPGNDALYWGVFNYPDAKKLMDFMEASGYVRTVRNGSVTLFEFFSSQEKVSFIPKTVSVNPMLNPISMVPKFSQTIWQEKQTAGIVFPFLRRDGIITVQDNVTSLSYPIQGNGQSYQVKKNEETAGSHQIDVSARQGSDGIVLTFVLREFPTINGKETKTPLREFTILNRFITGGISDSVSRDSIFSDWHILPSPLFGNLRLRIDGTILPLPFDFVQYNTYIGSVIVHSQNPAISILQAYQKDMITPSDIRLTDDPNCFSDKRTGYTADLKTTTTAVQLFGSNGSVCALTNISKYINNTVDHTELSLGVTGISENEEQSISMLSSLEKPTRARFCVRYDSNETCLNKHQLLSVTTGNDTIRLPIDQAIDAGKQSLLFISLDPITYQKSSVTITSPELVFFRTIASGTLSLPLASETFDVPASKNMSITWNKAISPFMFYYNPKKDSMYVSNMPCDANGFRTLRQYNNEMVTVIDRCYIESSLLLPFDSANFILWTTRYGLLSGKYPKFSLRDPFTLYTDEYLSLYQGYPDILGFKLLQKSGKTDAPTLTNALRNTTRNTAYTYLYRQPEYQDTREKKYTIHQDSENLGVVALSSMDIGELPTSWQDMELVPAKIETTYQIPSSVSFHKILSSLWKVTFTNEKEGDVLLRFNEGYDTQWRVIGGVKEQSHGKCDWFFNCFVVHVPEGTQTVYLFYTPEILSFLGWLATFGTSIFFLIRVKSIFSVL
jgi:hypothetical protein